MFAIIIIMVALVAILIVVLRTDTCPYCGSFRLDKQKIDPKYNNANWNVRCKRCGKEFYMK